MKLLNKTLLALTAVASFGAHASYLEVCSLQIRVKNVSKLLELDGTVSHDGSEESAKKLNFVAIVEVLNAQDRGSHNDNACKRKVGKLLALKIKQKEIQSIKEGDTFEVSYRYVNGQTRTGIGESTTIER